MAKAGVGGRPVQILKMNGRKFELDVHALRLTLLADHVKDKPVVVLSVAGAFSEGKSFLLNFFLRYLRNPARTDVNWLGEPEAAFRGFASSYGSDRDTTGILVWSEVFLVTTSEGQELAVVLMDTQGTFDSMTTTRVCGTIFALSTMVSSVLIYNVSQNIQGDDLQHLQLFAEYDQLALQEARKQPYHKLLFFLPRLGLTVPGHPRHGRGLKSFRKAPEDDSRAGSDLRLIRQRILSCFSTIGCIFMSHPVTKVATSEFLDRSLSGIDEGFKMQLLQLARFVLAPNKLLVKNVNGQKITCQDLIAYFEAYVRAFKNGEEPRSVYKAALKASNLAAKKKAKDVYIAEMVKAWETRDYEDREKMKEHHRRLLEESKRLFEAIPKMGGQEYSRRYLGKLTKEIGEIFDGSNRVFGKNKRIADTAAFSVARAVVTAGIAGAAIALAVVEIPAVATSSAAGGAVSLTGYICNTVKAFKRKHKRLEEGSEELLAATAEDSDSSFDGQTTESAQMEPGNSAEHHLATAFATDEEEALTEAANLSALTRAKQMYNVSMEQLCDDASPGISPHLLESHHKRLRKSAEELFSATCVASSVMVLPHFMERLSKEIDELFVNFVEQNPCK